MNLDTKVRLIQAKVDILRLKADNYNWQCSTPDDVKDELEATLTEINKELARFTLADKLSNTQSFSGRQPIQDK